MSAIAGTMDEPHYMCSRPDYEPISGKSELRDYLLKSQIKTLRNNWTPSWTTFQLLVSRGDRKGQAFMGCLTEEDYNRLTGTLIDPFHSDNERDILIALDYLLFSKD